MSPGLLTSGRGQPPLRSLPDASRTPLLFTYWGIPRKHDGTQVNQVINWSPFVDGPVGAVPSRSQALKQRPTNHASAVCEGLCRKFCNVREYLGWRHPPTKCPTSRGVSKASQPGIFTIPSPSNPPLRFRSRRRLANMILFLQAHSRRPTAKRNCFVLVN